jgi:hypothetical protein
MEDESIKKTIDHQQPNQYLFDLSSSLQFQIIFLLLQGRVISFLVLGISASKILK